MPLSSIPLMDVVEHLPDAVVCVDKSGQIAFANDSAHRLFGYATPALVGSDLNRLLPAGYVHRHAEQMSAFFATVGAGRTMGRRGGVWARRADGSLFECQISLVKLRNGRELVAAIIRDLTPVKLHAKEIERLTERHEAILGSAPDAIMITHAETGLILEANAQAGMLFRCDPADLVGIHQSELHPAPVRERYRRTFREHSETGRIWVRDAEVQTKCGLVEYVDIAASPRVIGGQPCIVGFLRDIAERRNREMQLSQALQEVEHASRGQQFFFAQMSHELRTPLNGIIGLSEVLALEILGPINHAKYREYASDINESGKHLFSVINNILDYSALTAERLALKPEQTALAELVDQAVRVLVPIARQQSVAIYNNLPGDLILRIDRSLMQQVFINILGNAVKFSPPGSGVWVNLVSDDDRGVSLAIHDSGEGIPPDRLDSIFELYSSSADPYARSRGGSGIGLPVSNAFVKAHGGRIEIESAMGLGTTVKLVFPCSARSR